VVTPVLDVPLVGRLDDGENSDDDVFLPSVPSQSVTSTSSSEPLPSSESVSAPANESLPPASLNSSGEKAILIQIMFNGNSLLRHNCH
jgi:hypothetical protein